MATRTPLGTAKTKADGTTLTLADVSASAGDCLVALVGFQQQSMPTVKWGQRDLNRSVAVVDTVTGFGGAIFIARSLKYTDTRDLVVTWPTAIGARVMAATKLDAGLIRDKSGRHPHPGDLSAGLDDRSQRGADIGSERGRRLRLRAAGLRGT